MKESLTMTPKEAFDDAAVRVKKLASAPSNEVLLELYGLYKQATEGDVRGSRPGFFDLKGRAKYDAWASRRGISREAAMTAYVACVDRLCKK
jgi:diazepam-binding inhibitor (GABA receptor modulator, acyl-CoA-binding protein)